MKNNILKPVIVLLILISFTSCKENEKGYELFNQYLSEKLESNDTSDQQLYLFIADDSCPGLIQSLEPYINSLKEERGVNIVIIGRSKKKLDYISKGFENRTQITYDTDGKAYDYNLLKPSIPTLYIKHSNDEVQIIEYDSLQKMKDDIDGLLKRA